MAEKYEQNLHTIESGIIHGATKLPVMTIGLGRVGDLKDVDGVIWHDENGNVVVSTKENPEGIVYNQDLILVVRVIGGKVLINGQYDMYCPASSKIDRLLSNPVILEEELTAEQLAELQPLFEATTSVVPSMAPAEYGRKVIIITADMLEGSDHLVCELPLSWSDGVPSFTDLYEGDILLVEDEASGKGYRIGAQEFAETHALD